MKVLHLNRKLEYFKGIDDLPIWNWFKIHTTNNLKYLCTKDPGDLSVKEVRLLEAAFEIIYDEYIDTFGISEEFRRVLELRREITWLKVELINTGDRTIENFIDIKESELKAIVESTQNVDHTDTKSYVEKFMGFQLRVKETSVKDYYGYVALMKKSQKTITHGGQDKERGHI